jgi:hypothetical protein
MARKSTLPVPPPIPVPPSEPVVFAAMPHYGPVELGAANAFFNLCAGEQDTFTVFHRSHGSSLLADSFNRLWCQALNARAQGVTHFAMLHADIVPRAGWLGVLLRELLAHSADLVSAVVPIKSIDGVTSTAIDSPNPFEVERRLTMAEVMQLPRTFSAADCGYPDRALLVNSGCWIADIRKPWAEQVRFQISNAITKNAAGQFESQVMSEDWDFSRQLHRLGATVLATRKVVLEHVGPHCYGNASAWGTKPIDHMAAGKPLPALMG